MSNGTSTTETEMKWYNDRGSQRDGMENRRNACREVVEKQKEQALDDKRKVKEQVNRYWARLKEEESIWFICTRPELCLTYGF